MDSLYEINIKNIQHLNKHISENDIIRQIILNLKYHFLRENNIYVDTESLPDGLRVDVDKILHDFKKEKEQFFSIKQKYYTPALINVKYQNYFIVAADKKVYDFDSDILIPNNYNYYMWCLALMVVQTPVGRIGEMLDSILVKNYNNCLKKLKYDIKRILEEFKERNVSEKFRIFEKSKNIEIDLFSIYEVDFKKLKKVIKIWFEYKESVVVENKNTKPNGTIKPPNFSLIKLNFSEELNLKIIKKIHKKLNKTFFDIDYKLFERHFKENKKEKIYIQWRGQVLELKAFIDLMCIKHISAYKSVFEEKKNNVLIEKHFIDNQGNNYTARRLSSTRSRASYNKIFDLSEETHPIVILYHEIKEMINNG